MAIDKDAIGFDEPAGKTIGLCMIVKDEAAVIERCLDSVRPLIDYVLIEDTGSTDRTQEIIRAYLRRHDIPGEVIEEKWRDFAYNRSHVMARLRDKPAVDYVLVMDADDRLVIEPGFDVGAFKAGLRADLYHVWIHLGGVRYHRPQICSNRREFYYRGVLHEFLEGPAGGFSSDTAAGVHIAAGVEGARSNDPEKYRKDALALERALADETDAFLRTRYTFYLAQSWHDSGEYEKSLAAYLDRAEQGGWPEEVYVSLYNAGKLQERLAERVETVVATLQRASELIPGRAEALHAASRACRIAGRYQLGYELATRGLDIPEPSTGLFIEPWIYQYGLLDELAVCAYWSQHYEDSFATCERLLQERKIPSQMVDRVTRNRDFARDRLDDDPAAAVSADSATAAQPPAVFIHSSWRTSSTWFLTKFRACAEAMAYFEPFNPLFAKGTAEQLKAWDHNYWDSHHPADDPYCLEYLPLLRKTGGIRRFRPEMEYAWFIPEGGLRGELRPQEQAYLALLVQQARGAGRVPVLGFTRSLARLGAIKQAFGDLHIFLHRNLWHQWQSFVRYKRQNVPFFYETTASILEANRADPFLNYLADFYLSKAPELPSGSDTRQRLLTLPEPDCFAMFAALHIYLYLHAQQHADLTVDVTRMSHDTDYRQSVERELAKTGLPISLADVAAGEDGKPRDIAVGEVRWDEIAGHAGFAAHFLEDLAPLGALRDRATELIAETRAAAERYANLVGTAPRPAEAPDAVARPRMSVVMMQRRGYPHSAAYRELAEVVFAGLAKLGYAVELLDSPADASGPVIVIGAQWLAKANIERLTPGSIIYNIEHTSSRHFAHPPYVELLKRYTVWDYDKINAERVSALTGKPVTHVTVGFTSALSRIAATGGDIDVLFYGSLNARRRRIIDQLQSRGLQVRSAFNVYGSERDKLIARAKVVINIHFYEPGALEILRVSYLMANRKAVVTEFNPGEYIDPDLHDGMVTAPYDQLAAACEVLVRDDEARHRLEKRAYDVFAARDEADLLAAALGVARPAPLRAIAPPRPSAAASQAASLYLDLMQRCLLNTIYEDVPIDWWSGGKYRPELRRTGRDWPAVAHTMIGEARLGNFRRAVEQAIKDEVPGDIIETGIWRGGACIMARAVLQAYGATDRIVWLADSFEGLPRPDAEAYPADAGDRHFEHAALAVSLEDVQANFEKYGLLDSQVKFLKGWFKDTLPGAPIEKLAVLRLDGDMYQSTIEAISALYDKVQPGGFVIVDDYGAVVGCREAITDFRRARGIADPIVDIDGAGVYWRKSI